MTIKRFHNQEEAYSKWLQDHPEGYVFNHFRGSNDNNNILHRAKCKSLHLKHNEGRRTVYEKVCSTDLEELISCIPTVRPEGGWRRCNTCDPFSGSTALQTPQKESSQQAPRSSWTKPEPRPTRSKLVAAPGVEVFTLWQPARHITSIEIEPRLANWDGRVTPGQLRLNAYLDELQAAFETHLHGSENLRGSEKKYCLHVEVVEASAVDLLTHCDLENYLNSDRAAS